MISSNSLRRVVHTAPIAILIAVAGLALAQPTSPDASKPATNASQPPKDAAPGSTPSAPATAKPTGAKSDAKPADPAAPTYPAAVSKVLYADNDLRGKKAPTLEVEEWLTEKPDTAGKTLLIDMWATWCPPCRQLIPELESFQQKFKGDLVVIGITDEPVKTYSNFVDLRGHAIAYSMARDGKKRMYSALGVKGIPHVLVISSDGIVRWQGFPLSDDDRLTEDKLKQIIDADKAARAKKPDPAANVPGSKPGDNKKTATAPPSGK